MVTQSCLPADEHSRKASSLIYGTVQAPCAAHGWVAIGVESVCDTQI